MRLFHESLYSLKVENDLPVQSGPRLLLAPHINSLGSHTLVVAIKEPVAVVYSTTTDPWYLKFVFNHIGLPGAGGHIQRNGIWRFLNEGVPVLHYPQLDFQGQTIDSVSHSIVRVVQLWEQRTKREVKVIPVGLEQKIPQFPIQYLPMPHFKLPIPGTHSIVRFGTPEIFGNRSALELTRLVMKEVAKLSKLEDRL